MLLLRPVTDLFHGTRVGRKGYLLCRQSGGGGRMLVVCIRRSSRAGEWESYAKDAPLFLLSLLFIKRGNEATGNRRQLHTHTCQEQGVDRLRRRIRSTPGGQRAVGRRGVAFQRLEVSQVSFVPSYVTTVQSFQRQEKKRATANIGYALLISRQNRVMFSLSPWKSP